MVGLRANALEADVKFDKKTGKLTYIYHGTPCDPGRDCTRWAYVNKYVDALKGRVSML